MRIPRLLAPIAASVLLFACSPSPEKVCGHIADLLEKDGTEKLSSDKRSKFVTDCTQDGEKQKSKDSDAYNKCAKCMMSIDSMKDMESKCKSECPKNE